MKTRSKQRLAPGALGERGRRKGSSLIEFALVLPPLLTLVIGIMEFGWLVKNTLLLANATREGVRSASVGRSSSDTQARINNSAQPLVIAPPSGSTVMQYSADNGVTFLAWPPDALGKNSVPVGSLVKISTTASHRALTGFFPFLTSRKLQTFVTMRREL